MIKKIQDLVYFGQILVIETKLISNSVDFLETKLAREYIPKIKCKIDSTPKPEWLTD